MKYYHSKHSYNVSYNVIVATTRLRPVRLLTVANRAFSGCWPINLEELLNGGCDICRVVFYIPPVAENHLFTKIIPRLFHGR